MVNQCLSGVHALATIVRLIVQRLDTRGPPSVRFSVTPATALFSTLATRQWGHKWSPSQGHRLDTTIIDSSVLLSVPRSFVPFSRIGFSQIYKKSLKKRYAILPKSAVVNVAKTSYRLVVNHADNDSAFLGVLSSLIERSPLVFRMRSIVIIQH